ncbi:helix-turn-helix transcriptional regulator [Leifsonia shinshuensis]
MAKPSAEVRRTPRGGEQWAEHRPTSTKPDATTKELSMGYSEWRCATGAVGWRAVAEGSELRVAPDGALDLMWFRERLVVAGPDTRSMLFDTRPGETTWGIRLDPGVAHALLGLPVEELTDRRVELAELTHPPRVPGHAFDEDAAGALEQVLVALWATSDPDRAALRHAASVDRAARAGLPVAASAELHEMSPRSLQRLCRRVFGYGPKTLMEIHRFQRALRLVRGGTSLSTAAAMAGYFDQAHFARECRRLTGQAPSDLAVA